MIEKVAYKMFVYDKIFQQQDICYINKEEIYNYYFKRIHLISTTNIPSIIPIVYHISWTIFGIDNEMEFEHYDNTLITNSVFLQQELNEELKHIELMKCPNLINKETKRVKKLIGFHIFYNQTIFNQTI